MAVNYLTSVPKLLGRENYDEWSFALENVLVLEGLSKCIDGTEQGTTLVAKAKAELILTIDPALYLYVKDAKTAKEVWTSLKTKLFDMRTDSASSNGSELQRPIQVGRVKLQ